MFIGLIAALAASAIQPLSFLLYGNVATTLVNSQISATLASKNISAVSSTNLTSSW